MMHLLLLSGYILPPLPAETDPALIAQHGISFFSTWIARVGGLVAFIGAVKFGLSVKSDDAREQLQAVLTMVSGFMIVAAVGNLGTFEISSSYTVAAANAEFAAILRFIGSWARRVGALALFIGAIMFGLATKDNNPGSKVAGLKTMAAGGITAAVSTVLPLFVT
jgi:hypothetical protein